MGYNNHYMPPGYAAYGEAPTAQSTPSSAYRDRYPPPPSEYYERPEYDYNRREHHRPSTNS